MTYNDKIKASNIIINGINGLKDGDKLRVSYGVDSDDMPINYYITCHTYGTGTSYSIYRDDVWAMTGMNISSVGKTSMVAYTSFHGHPSGSLRSYCSHGDITLTV